MERLLQFFTPIHYDLNLTIDRTHDSITGVTTIRGVAHQGIIKLHSVGLEILAVTVADTDADFRQVDDTLEIFLPDHAASAKSTTAGSQNPTIADPKKPTTTTPEKPASSATPNPTTPTSPKPTDSEITVAVSYRTSLNRNMQGCYLSTYDYKGAEQRLVATQFESHYAREAFPCIDEPAAKASFRLALTVPDLGPRDVVLANTPLVAQTDQRFEFEPTPRMSTYLLAWVVGPLQHISTTNRHGVEVASYAALNQSLTSLEFANEVAARALDYYDEKFGVKYPLPKLDQVALPDFEAGAMENWGLVTYRESCMLAEPDAALDTKQSVAVTVTHELSHQWFGDLVTMEWWDDLWLNESFATIMEYCATDALYPEFEAWQDFYTGDCVAALRRDCLPGVQAVKQPVHDPAEIATLFDGAIVYAKGARLVLMLMRAMGEDNFYRGVHDYFERFQYQNTVGDDLWNALQPYADFELRDFIHAWISQPGYPVLARTDSDDWQQHRFLIDGSTDDSRWPLSTVTDDMSGHYLINLDDREFQQRLAAFSDLTPEAKLRLLIDRMLLAKARAVPSSSLLDLLPKFSAENAAVWDILLGIVNDLKAFFDDATPEEDSYRAFLRGVISSRLAEVGVSSRPGDTGDTKRLRNILLAIARFARDEDAIDRLCDLYRDDLANLDSELRGNILMAKMLRDEDAVFAEFSERYPTETDPETKDDLLGAIAAARSPEHIATNIALLLRPDVVRPQDHLYLYIYLLRNPKARPRALAWLYEHWSHVERLTGEKSIEDYPRCTAGFIHTRAEADAFYAFFDQKSDQPVLRRALAMARVSIESRLRLVAEESAAVHARLRELQSSAS